MSSKVETSPFFLREKYHEQGWTLSEIADEVGCSIGTVHNRMEEHDIARQNPKAWKERICVECAHRGKEKRIEQWQCEAHERFFCDNECQGAFLAETGLSRGENNGRWKEKIIVECANCRCIRVDWRKRRTTSVTSRAGRSGTRRTFLEATTRFGSREIIGIAVDGCQHVDTSVPVTGTAVNCVNALRPH